MTKKLKKRVVLHLWLSKELRQDFKIAVTKEGTSMQKKMEQMIKRYLYK